MFRHALIAALAAGTMFMAGCGFTMVAVSHPRYYRTAPSYCYDCHNRQVWHGSYASCGYYSIRVANDGYYYRPHRHARGQNYLFSKHDFSNEKNIRSKHHDHEKEGKPVTEKGRRSR